MECLTTEMIVLLPVVRVLVLLPPLWVSLGLRLMMMMEWNRFQKLKRSKKIPQRSPESMFCGKTYIAVLLIHKLSHLIRKPRKEICIFCPYGGSGSVDCC